MKPMITYDNAKDEDIEPIYQLCKQLILDYEDLENIDVERVFSWVHKKIVDSISEYKVVYVDGCKAGYYHFYKNEDACYEIDDLYIFKEFQNRGIGTAIIQECCLAVDKPVMLYVFIKNHRAISLYQKLGFEIVETIKNSRFVMKRINY